MIKADVTDKALIIDILANAFDENQSVNYIVKQDGKRKERIRSLMAYSFEMCNIFGAAYLADDKKACALVLYPDQKRFTISTLILNLKLLINAIGLTRIGEVMRRESAIKSNYPNVLIYHLWFLGVYNSEQNKGIGSKLLTEIIADSRQQDKVIYLETSSPKNVQWYQKFGFKIYNEVDFNYKLFMLMWNK